MLLHLMAYEKGNLQQWTFKSYFIRSINQSRTRFCECCLHVFAVIFHAALLSLQLPLVAASVSYLIFAFRLLFCFDFFHPITSEPVESLLHLSLLEMKNKQKKQIEPIADSNNIDCFQFFRFDMNNTCNGVQHFFALFSSQFK